MNFNDIIHVIKNRLLNILLKVNRCSVILLNVIAFNKSDPSLNHIFYHSQNRMLSTYYKFSIWHFTWQSTETGLIEQDYKEIHWTLSKGLKCQALRCINKWGGVSESYVVVPRRGKHNLCKLNAGYCSNQQIMDV